MPENLEPSVEKADTCLILSPLSQQEKELFE